MNDLTQRLFESELGRELYKKVTDAIEDSDMMGMLGKGVLVGLSGGADSVALLLVLLKLRQLYPFHIKAVHVNHMIRADEANRDEDFSRELCKSLSVEFSSHRIDVPAIATNRKCGLEEAARDVRYEIFQKEILDEQRLSCIAVAHNASDNLETIIFNMMRGCGVCGLSGIAPVRDNIVRPLIYAPKSLIKDSLSDANIPFVEDSTNNSLDYSRNYIRHEIIPRLSNINSYPELMGTRISQILRDDNDYLNELAEYFIEHNEKNGQFEISDIQALKKPVFSRVLMLLCKKNRLPAPEKVHIDKIFSIVKNGDFKLSIPGQSWCVCERGKFFILKKTSATPFSFELRLGLNIFEDFNTAILVSEDNSVESYSNIYKKSIQAKFNFDIIKHGLRVRSKIDGDSYKYGNMTRKLKKLFCDKKVGNTDKNNIPVFYDDKGILWVPGFGIRDQEITNNTYYVTILDPHKIDVNKRSFYICI